MAGAEQILHCVCGATRPAPVGMRTLSCPSCGRAMTPPADLPTPAPKRWLLAAATLVSQLLAIGLFTLALLWMIRHGDRSYLMVGFLVAGASGVFAGGSAHRGWTGALVGCAVLDLALSIACLSGAEHVKRFVAVPVVKLAPAFTRVDLAVAITGVVAAVAATACLLAIPQARRFAAWHDQRIEQAARRRG